MLAASDPSLGFEAEACVAVANVVAYSRMSGPWRPYSLQCVMCRSEKRHLGNDLGGARADQDQHPPPAILPVPVLFLINPSGQRGRLLRHSRKGPQLVTYYIFSSLSFVNAFGSTLKPRPIHHTALQNILALQTHSRHAGQVILACHDPGSQPLKAIPGGFAMADTVAF